MGIYFKVLKAGIDVRGVNHIYIKQFNLKRYNLSKSRK